MNLICASHPEVAAIARCVSCGHHLCTDCRRKSGVKNYCSRCIDMVAPIVVRSPHAAAAVVALPLASPSQAASVRQPWLAAALSFVPGLGQMYAGRFLRGVAFLGTGLGLQNSAHLTPILASFFFVFNLYDAFRVAQVRNERLLKGAVTERFDDVLFAMAGVLVLAFSAFQQGGMTHLTDSTLAFLGSMATGLWIAHQTRR